MKLKKKDSSVMEKSVKVYDGQLNLVDRKYSYEFTPITIADNAEGDAKVTALENAVEKAIERVKAGAGETELSRLLGALNKVSEYFASRSARAEALQGALAKKKVNAFVVAFSGFPPFSDIADKKARREAILASMRSNTALLETLTADVDDEDDNDSNEG